MASQGPNNPATATNLAQTGYAWSNPNNVFASDSSYAIATPISNFADSLQVNNFGFSIPTGATIDGIVFEIQRVSAAVSNYYFFETKAMKALTKVGTSHADFNYWTTTEAYITLGNSTDLWGTTWTPAEINATGFGIQLLVANDSNNSVSGKINHVRCTVYYSLSPTISPSTSSLSDFGSVAVGSTSSEQSFTVSGSNLTADIVVTAPTDFEVSTTSGSGFGSSVTLTQSGGSVGSTTIYTHFKPGTRGSKSGNIALTTTGGTTQNVSVTGTATGAPPNLKTKNGVAAASIKTFEGLTANSTKSVDGLT